MRLLSRLLVLGALGSAIGALAQSQPGLEENYDYPSADKILAERGVRLLKGDGHILLADCDSPELVEVWGRGRAKLCFRIKGSQGSLTLEIPEVYLIKADNHTLTVKVTVGGATTSVALKKNEWSPIGEGNPESGPATLVELRASP